MLNYNYCNVPMYYQQPAGYYPCSGASMLPYQTPTIMYTYNVPTVPYLPQAIAYSCNDAMPVETKNNNKKVIECT